MRALVASVGASAALVAGAAAALFFVSLLVGYDGFSGYLDGSSQQTAIRISAARAASPAERLARAHGAAPIIVAPPRPRRSKPAAPVVEHHASQSVRTGSGVAVSAQPTTTASSQGDVPALAAPKAAKPTVGDGVRQLGDDVSSTVQHTAGATGAVTKLLGPPVSAAVQKVLDLLSSLLKNTTGALGSTPDKLLPKQR